MKTYLIRADLDEDSPYYTFIVKARDEYEAREKAEETVEEYYGNEVKIYVDEVKTLDDVVNFLG